MTQASSLQMVKPPITMSLFSWLHMPFVLVFVACPFWHNIGENIGQNLKCVLLQIIIFNAYTCTCLVINRLYQQN